MIDLAELRREAKWRGYRVSVRGGVVCVERDGDTEHFEQSPAGLEAAFDWLLTKLPPAEEPAAVLVRDDKPWWKWPWWE